VEKEADKQLVLREATMMNRTRPSQEIKNLKDIQILKMWMIDKKLETAKKVKPPLLINYNLII
jgi:hypothetical protein